MTDKAESDLQAIHEHYAPHSGIKAANDVIFRTVERLEQLTMFSEIGRPSQFRGKRELVFVRHPIIATYQIKNNQVQNPESSISARHEEATTPTPPAPENSACDGAVY